MWSVRPPWPHPPSHLVHPALIHSLMHRSTPMYTTSPHPPTSSLVHLALLHSFVHLTPMYTFFLAHPALWHPQVYISVPLCSPSLPPHTQTHILLFSLQLPQPFLHLKSSLHFYTVPWMLYFVFITFFFPSISRASYFVAIIICTSAAAINCHLYFQLPEAQQVAWGASFSASHISRSPRVLPTRPHGE